jgi:predicted Zn-dependent protease
MRITILILFLFSSCSMLDPDDNEINKMSLQAFEEVRQQATLSTNKEWTAMLDRVATRITANSGEDFDWEWMLIESPEKNAWCMPGGKIAVYTGIMPVLQNEAALAAVLGHEVAHATKRHGKERYARAIRGSVAGLVIGSATAIGGQLWCKSPSCKMLTGLGGAVAGFAITFFDRKFSREDETEADQEGQIFMARAGYDPEAAIGVWERMAKEGGAEPPEILSTHPASARRQENLKGWLSKANQVYEDAPQRHGMGEAIK